MEHPHHQDVTRLRWERVAIKLDLALHSVQSPVTPLDSMRITWADIPMTLAVRGLLLQGLPAICIPAPDKYVQEDKLHDSLFLWSNERLEALDKALSNRTLTIVAREPLSRRAIFQLIDADGRRRDSTLGFSEDWQMRNMFTEQVYLARTSAQLRTMNIESLLPILRNANLTTTHLPWASLPPKLWSSGQYMSGLPRICLPTVVNNKVSADDPSPTTNWKKDQRVALQRSLDSGQLKILPRPPERNVLFEVLDPDGSLCDTDCGVSDSWKLEHITPPSKEKRSHRRKAARESQTKVHVPLPDPTMIWPQFHQTESYQKKMNVTEHYMRLLRAQGLLLDSPEGPAWVYVPQMLATKRRYVCGLPRICLPLVRDDDVLANYDPRQWSDSAQDAFIQALDRGQVKIFPAKYGERTMYKTFEMNGELKNELLGFSEKWCKENLDPPDFSSISQSAYNIEMWLEMLESVGIPCHDLRGRRRIQWLQLPLVLAHRRLYISGCPIECLPRAEDDVVLELSSPYFYNDRQVALMYEAFTKKNVAINSRAHHRNVLFVIETDTGSMELNCGFSNLWIQMNMQTLPNTARNVPKPIPVPLPVPTVAASAIFSTAPTNVSTQRHLVHQRTGPAPAMAGTAYPTPTDSAPASPIPFPSAVAQQMIAEDPSHSLKIIIPAFKRRHLSTTTASSSSSSSSQMQGIQFRSTVSRIPPPQPKSPPEPFVTESRSLVPARHMLASRRSVATIEHPLPRRQRRQPSPVTSDTEDHPGAFGLRASMSPRLPPVNTLPDPLPPVPLPGFLPKPGGNLRWDEERNIWELTISEVWPPDEWKKRLPIFPARVIWNSVQNVWMCEPSKSLTPPHKTNVGLSLAVQAALQACTRDGNLEPIEEGLSIIWHRWRRSWGLFEYTPPISSPTGS